MLKSSGLGVGRVLTKHLNIELMNGLGNALPDAVVNAYSLQPSIAFILISDHDAGDRVLVHMPSGIDITSC